MQFHIHVLFEIFEQESVTEMRRQLLARLSARIRVGDLMLSTGGPLPLPMFELQLDEQDLNDVRNIVDELRGHHSVLIHPLLADEWAAHITQAQWLGRPLPLHLDRL